LLMNMHDVSESVAGLAIALLTLMVCSSAGERVKRFWPRQFFVLFSAGFRFRLSTGRFSSLIRGHINKSYRSEVYDTLTVSSFH
ncbi:hypothetical protein ACSLOS_31520, partial [Klebsiella pneumoniae]